MLEPVGAQEYQDRIFVLVSSHLGLGLLVICFGSRIPILVLPWLWHPIFIMHVWLMFDEMLYFDLVICFFDYN